MTDESALEAVRASERRFRALVENAFDGVTLIGRLFEEGTLGRVGIALERAFAVANQRPPSF